MDQKPEDVHQEEAVKRIVGIATLRRLRHMVNAEQAKTVAQRKRARFLLAGILLITVAGLGFLLRNEIFG